MLIGTFQTSGKGLSDFQNAVCGGIVGTIPSCGSNIQVYADADGVDPSNFAVASSSYWNGASGTFNVGGPSQYMVLQVGYQFPYFIPWFAKITGGGSALIVSTLVFQVDLSMIRGRILLAMKRLGANCKGLALVEFALVAPLLIVLYLGTIEGTSAVRAYMKVNAATQAYADLSPISLPSPSRAWRTTAPA